MVRALAVLAVLAASAHAAPAPMTAASDRVCDLLRADRHDACRQAARLRTAHAIAYQAGSSQLRRFVLAIADGDATLISPAIDLADAGDATLVSTTPSLRQDGDAIVLAIAARYRGADARWQIETDLRCAHQDRGAWACSTVELPAVPIAR